MFIGYDFFGLNGGAVFETKLCHPTYFRTQLRNATYDHIYIDEDVTIPYSTEKPDGWNYRTVLNAGFDGDLEGGSISGFGMEIQKIRFQRRRVDELRWEDVAEIPYTAGEQILYEAIDKYIQNDFIYQYSLLPITSTVLGTRVNSEEITADFEGIFISDQNNNYKLFYDIEFGEIQHNTPNTVLEPLNAQFPVVSYSNLDYKTGDNITALFLSTSTVDQQGNVDVRMEKLGRQQLIQFLKNRKPKVMRSTNGESMLISIIGNPREVYNDTINGIATISFSYVEIGNMDSKTLAKNGLLQGLTEVF